MFIEVTDLGDSIFGQSINIITDGDNDVVLHAIEQAIGELRLRLAEPKDELGEPQYNVDAILRAEDDERNRLILRHAITMAKWYIAELCNASSIYEQAHERYQSTLKFFDSLSDGSLKPDSLSLYRIN